MTQVQAKNTAKTNWENANFPERKVRLTGPSWRMPKAMKNLLGMTRNVKMRSSFKQAMVEADAYAKEQAIQLAKKKDKKTAAMEN